VYKLEQKLLAEFIGTFWLVFGGCGSAVLAAQFLTGTGSPINLGIGFVGVALAFGLTVLTMAYAIGHISGCHLNPAVTLGLVAARKFEFKDALYYIAVQVAGAISASAILYLIASNINKNILDGGLAANGFGSHSPAGYALAAAFAIEVVLTAVFLLIILGSTDEKAPKGFAPIAIGLGLTLIHLISIPVTNTSVNPARSTGPAVILGIFSDNTWALEMLWLFWVAPIVGGLIAGFAWSYLQEKPEEVEELPRYGRRYQREPREFKPRRRDEEFA
jgi:aquaporin Z